jgi:hypothetical protein
VNHRTASMAMPLVDVQTGFRAELRAPKALRGRITHAVRDALAAAKSVCSRDDSKAIKQALCGALHELLRRPEWFPAEAQGDAARAFGLLGPDATALLLAGGVTRTDISDLVTDVRIDTADGSGKPAVSATTPRGDRHKPRSGLASPGFKAKNAHESELSVERIQSLSSAPAPPIGRSLARTPPQGTAPSEAVAPVATRDASVRVVSGVSIVPRPLRPRAVGASSLRPTFGRRVVHAPRAVRPVQ